VLNRIAFIAIYRKFSLDRNETDRKTNWACARASNASQVSGKFSVLFCSVPKKLGSSSTFSVCSSQKLEEQV